MNIGFLVRQNSDLIWGGDLAVVLQFIRGLTALGHKAACLSSPFADPEVDFLLVNISSFDHRQEIDDIILTKKPFGVLAYYEDLTSFHCLSTGISAFIRLCLKGEESIEMLYQNPHLCCYFSNFVKRDLVFNFQPLQKAKLWIANSSTEGKILQRDHPNASIDVIPVPPGLVTEFTGEPDDSFIQFSGLTSGQYILQIGRLEIRKNQLSTILATRDLDIPLVFICTKSGYHYEIDCFETAAKWRKAPTLFISQTLKASARGNARIIEMPHGKKLPLSMIASAYHHAGLYLHPAFNELPGAIFLEAARFGTPTIASTSCTINDYFYDPIQKHSRLDGRIAYCDPCDFAAIKDLTEQLFGKKFPPLLDHPAIRRTETDFASDLVRSLQSRALV